MGCAVPNGFRTRAPPEESELAQRFAGSLALVAFFTACGLGLVRGSAFDATIRHAILSLWVFGVVGLLFGALAVRAVEESSVAKRNTQAQQTAEAKATVPPRGERPIRNGATRRNEP